MDKISSVWTNLLIRPGDKAARGSELREQNRKNRRFKSHELVIHLIKKELPELAEGQSNLTIADEKIDELLALIYETSPPRDIKLCHNFFSKGLSKGVREKNWDVKIPATIVNLKRKKSPFTPKSFQDINKLRPFKELFNQSISDPLFYHDDSQYLIRSHKSNKNHHECDESHIFAGQLIFSAIVNGVLLNKKWIKELPRGISDNTIVESNLLWIELKITQKNYNETENLYHRWFPDPLTSLLLLKWNKKYGGYWPKIREKEGQVKYLLSLFFKSIGAKNLTLNQLIKFSTSSIGLQLPQYLITYASSFDKSLSLSPISWARLYSSTTQKISINKEPEKSFEALPLLDQFTVLDEPISADIDDQFLVLKKFRSIKNNSGVNVPSTIRQLDNLLNQTQSISPLLYALIHWCKDMLSNKRKGKVGVSTMFRYMSSIAKPLIIAGSNLGVLQSKIHDIDCLELYELVLEEEASQKERHYKTGRLNDFHSFLVLRFSCNKLHLKYDGRLASVDVNLITPKEFYSLKNALLNNPTATSRVKRIQQLLVCLGYRCGLRANEALSIMVSEVHDGQYLNEDDCVTIQRSELLIKYNQLGKLKNASSKRRISIGTLLNREELELLTSWKKERLQEIYESGKSKVSNEPLFCLEADDNFSPAYHEVFPDILLAIKTITRDETTNFHHLRHSFANFLLLRLISDEIKDILPNSWCRDETHNFIWNELDANNKSLRSKLLVTSESRPSRKILYLLSSLLGHIDPEVTMGSYLHLLDWILGHALRQNKQSLAFKSQATLLGLTDKKLKAYRNRNKLKGETISLDLLEIEIKKFHRKLPNPVNKKMIPLELTELVPCTYQKKDQIPSPFMLHHILAATYFGKDIEFITTEYEKPRNLLHKWIHTAKKLSQIKTSRDTYRFFKKASSTDKVKDQSVIRTIPGYCPTLPTGKHARRQALNIYHNLHKLYITDPVLAKEGLNLFVKNASFQKVIMATRINSERKLYVNFMKKLVNTYQIQVDIEPNPEFYDANEKDKTHKESMKYWKKELGLPKSNYILQKSSRVNKTVNIHGKPTIWIRADKKSGHDKNINYIIRFALFMGMVSLDIGGYRH